MLTNMNNFEESEEWGYLCEFNDIWSVMSSQSLSDAARNFTLVKKNKIFGSLKASLLYESFASLEKCKLWSRFYVGEEDNNTDVLDILAADQKIITNPSSVRRRRTVILRKDDRNEFGFTVQTYVVQKQSCETPMKVTYIDNVNVEGPAADAGIRSGDVIKSINGAVVTDMSHKELIALIKSCQQIRMILVYEDINSRIQLIARCIRLKKVLNDKLYQLNFIETQEKSILQRARERKLTDRKTDVSEDDAYPYSLPLPTSSSRGENELSFAESEPRMRCQNNTMFQQDMAKINVTEFTANVPVNLKIIERSTVNSCFDGNSCIEVTRL